MGQQPMRMFVISQSVSSPHPRLPLHRLEVRLRCSENPGGRSTTKYKLQHAIMWLMPSSHITHQLITLQTHPVYCSHEHVVARLVTCEIGLHGWRLRKFGSASATVSRRPLGTGCAGLLSADEYPAPRAGRQGASQGVVVWRATGSAKIRSTHSDPRSLAPRSLLRTAS